MHHTIHNCFALVIRLELGLLEAVEYEVDELVLKIFFSAFHTAELAQVREICRARNLRIIIAQDWLVITVAIGSPVVHCALIRLRHIATVALVTRFLEWIGPAVKLAHLGVLLLDHVERLLLAHVHAVHEELEQLAPLHGSIAINVNFFEHLTQAHHQVVVLRRVLLDEANCLAWPFLNLAHKRRQVE